MEYEKIDEVTRREACEKVKIIAEAIKKIRKKYYLCFDKISDDDKKRYNALKMQMQNVADENGLNKFYVELMSDIEEQYNEKIPNDMDENGMPNNNSVEQAYQMYIKANQLHSEFLMQLKKSVEPKIEKACMKRILKIQSYIKKLVSFLEKSYSKKNLNAVKRNILSNNFAKSSKEYFNKLFQNSYKEANEPFIKQDILNNIINERDVEQITR